MWPIGSRVRVGREVILEHMMCSKRKCLFLPAEGGGRKRRRRRREGYQRGKQWWIHKTNKFNGRNNSFRAHKSEQEGETLLEHIMVQTLVHNSKPHSQAFSRIFWQNMATLQTYLLECNCMTQHNGTLAVGACQGTACVLTSYSTIDDVSYDCV